MSTTPNWSLQIVPDTASNHTFNNTLLQTGQFGVETDTGRFKLGDGVTPWNNLTFMTAGAITSVWFGASTDGTNLLGHSPVDGGMFLDPKKLAASAALAEGLAGNFTSIDLTAYNLASPHLAAAAQTGLILRNLMAAMGTDFANLGAFGSPVGGKTLQMRIKEISDMISNGQLDFTKILKDTVTESTSTWSSQKILGTINSLVNTALSNLVGTAPEALNTVYELADALLSNQGLVNTISQELGNCVKITAQTLTEAQKSQARANIGAPSIAFVGLFSELPTATPTFDAIITAALADTTTAPLLPNLYF